MARGKKMRNIENRPHAIKFTQPSMAQQHMKDEVDVNKIMERYTRTGVIDHVNKYSGQYTECRDISYHDAMNEIIKADDMFMELPSKVRKQFGNDPGKFLDFVSDPDNHDKIYEYGLADRPPSGASPAASSGGTITRSGGGPEVDAPDSATGTGDGSPDAAT